MLADIGLFTAYGLIIIAALGSITFSIIDISRNPQVAVKALIGIGVFVLVILISYLVTSGTGAERHDDISATRAHLTGASLMLLYITGTLALLSLIVSVIMESFR